MKVVLQKSRLNHPGGLEKYTLRLAKAFREQGCEVTILTTGESPKIEELEMISLANHANDRQFDHLCQKWVRENPHECVFGMEWTTSQTHYRAGNGVHATYLKQRSLIDSPLKQFSFQINPRHRFFLRQQKKAYEHPDLKTLFTNSEMVRREVLERFSISPGKIEVVYNGVEWEEWEEAFSHTPIREVPYQFLFVGHDFRRKGLEFLLKGLDQIKEDVELTVVGKGDPIPHKNVHYVGMQRDLIPFYQHADALVIPSIYDPFANVTVEALAMGLFVVSSRFNGGYEILTPMTGAVIEELTSPESVASALQTALSHPKTPKSATLIRNSIKELDFSLQLDKIVSKCIS